MFFLHREDLLAIHTVAAAARSIVKHLAETKGIGHLHETRHALEQMYQEAVAAAARSSEMGTILEEVHRDTLAAVGGYIARDAATKGIVLTNISLDADPTSPKIAAALDQRARTNRRTHQYRNKPANFWHYYT